MIRCSCLAVVTLFIAVIFPKPAPAQEALVLNRADDTATIIDLASGETLWCVSVGDDPHEVSLSPDGRYAFISSYGANTIHVLDLVERTKAKRFVLDGYDRLHGVRAAKTEAVVWVTAESHKALLELDASDGRVRRVWQTDQEMSHMVTGTADDAKLYVANIGSGSVTVIDRRAGTERTVTAGAGTEGVAVSPHGDVVWAANRGDDTISVIDIQSDSVLATFSSRGDFPVKLAFAPDGGQVWVTLNRGGAVAVFDADSQAHLGSIQVGQRPLGIGFAPDGRHALVTRPGANEVVMISVVDRTIVQRIPTGRSPDGVVWLDPTQ